MRSEDARRIVACWNACEGLSTEAIETIAALGGVLHKMPVAAGLVVQRDELLNALRELVEAVEDNERDSLRELIVAHAAIAKATGEAA